LLTTVVILGLAAFVGNMAMQEFERFSPVPKRFLRTIQEDLQWAKTQMKSNVA